MKKALVTVGIAIITLSLLPLVVLTIGWEEDRSGVQFKVDNKNGNT